VVADDWKALLLNVKDTDNSIEKDRSILDSDTWRVIDNRISEQVQTLTKLLASQEETITGIEARLSLRLISALCLFISSPLSIT
jgi:hypothetical protein